MNGNNKTILEMYSDHKGKVSDKWTSYLQEYDLLFKEFRDKPIRMLEIGVQNGGGLEIWSKYFRDGSIFIGCEIDPNSAALRFDDPRIKLVIGDANATSTQKEILSHSSELDIVIDDGSHCSGDIIQSFLRYFPNVVDGGLYVVEDLHTSYWKEYEGGLFDPFSSISFFKRLVDIINFEHWGIERNPEDILNGFLEKYGVEVQEEILQNIHSIKFINSLCIILKSPKLDNRLGTRFIAGSTMEVYPDMVNFHESLPVPPSQTSNFWSSRIRPPDEEYIDNEQTMQALRAQVAGLEQELQMISAQLVVKDKAIIRNMNVLQERASHITYLENVIDSIYRSTSWKITLPLRDAKTIARKILGLPYSIIKGTGSAIYHAIPITNEKNIQFKNAVFQKFPSFFRQKSEKELLPATSIPTDIDPLESGPISNPDLISKEIQSFPHLRIVDRRKISVIITSYNHERYIRQCVDSILDQTGNYDLEIIVGDDCSEDNTRQILQKYLEKYPQIFRLMPMQSNMGVTKNLKRCLDACQGDFIAICEGDDYWTDEYKLEKQMQFLENHNDFSMVFSSFLIFYEEENDFSPFNDPILLDKYEFTTEDLVLNNFIGNFSCCMYRTDTVRKLPPEIFDEFTVDWMFNLACGEIGNIGFIRDYMSVYRNHSKGAWAGKPVIEQTARMHQLIDIYDKLLAYKYHDQFIAYKNKLTTSEKFQKDLLILDTVFPHPLSPFRYQEFISYLDHFSSSMVLTTGEHFLSFFDHRSVAEVIVEFEKEHPEYENRTIGITHDIGPYDGRLAYVVFLFNMKVFLATLEKKRIPFIFTLYPGGAFELNKPTSDEALVRIFNSPQFRKVIVTQKITLDYLISKKFCNPDKIEFIFGVVTPLDLIKPYLGKKFFGFEKDTLDICFVSHKYMPKGIDKGYDVFIEVARKLSRIHKNIYFHVVGSFDESDIPLKGLKERITFYGLQKKEWFDNFYLNKDIILSPNIPFKIAGVDGAFDGFPTASCTEAGLRKVAVFCTDELNLNVKFNNGEDLVIIPHDSERIVEILETYYDNPALLKRLAETGSTKFSTIYNYENQILPRIRIIEAELGKQRNEIS